MLDILYEIHQNSKIGMATSQASAGLRQAERAKEHAGSLEERIDKMALLNLALWTILKEKLNVTDHELAERVQELDLLDGKLDGRIQGTPIDCPDCERPVHQRHRRCLYCGLELQQNGFESVVR